MSEIEHINKVADVAGILRRKGMVQTLAYSESWMQEEYRLLELPPSLTDALEAGENFVIRGDTDDDTVLCTKEKTYSLKAADTSNALLVIPGLTPSKSKDFVNENICTSRPVETCFSSYYEVKPIRPRLERLRSILDDSAYKNKDGDEGQELGEIFNTEGLLNLIQASEKELLTALEGLGALQIDGNWRILDVSYQEKAFAQILALVEEEQWDWKEVPLETCSNVLNELYPRFVIQHCLKLYGDEVVSDETKPCEENLYCLSEDKVCKFYAEYILRPAGKFNYHEFMEAWKQSVPDGMAVAADHLQGVALIDENSHPPVIWHFPERNLPEDPGLRFNTLFKTRTKWRHSDIEPYLRGILAPGQALNALFLKYARSAKDDDGEKVYSSKRPVK